MEEQVIQFILENASSITYPVAVIVVAIFVLRPVVPVFADWLRVKMSSKTDDENEGLITLETLNTKLALATNDNHHELIAVLQEIKEALGRVERQLSYLEGKINGR